MEIERANAFAVGPGTRPEMHDALSAAVREAGGSIVPIEQAHVLIWDDPGAAAAFPDYISLGPDVDWVQLPFAGIEPFVSNLDHEHLWTSGKGVYAAPVAEWIMAALLTSFRDMHIFSKATSWPPQSGRNLLGASITVLGGGGITRSLLPLLQPWGCEITVVRRTPDPLPGAATTLGLDQINDAVAGADAVVVALALTDTTRGLIDAALLAEMRSDAWLINVGRGGHVVTEDLILALERDVIAGAVLDVTEPEPLPADSALWSLPNCIITPHVGNTPQMGLPLIADRVRRNTALWLSGEQLLGVVDVEAGY